ncbi:MAG: glycosyltransferase [Hydrogenophaga sp.]|jgi:colanic acid/amylovoran biosynthesis glycosyltransferase|uniref:glycosyltransferase n=1 Tax=Hydrogenophaga sp. TaxID=1904254 RepID=UPI002613FB03|nr:glycosyltransferase [Hydrogenophaga sp.]MCV0440852.1 glycosyltransferase [Hydrogenophaga sp.]
MSDENDTLLLYAPVPLYSSENGYLLEDQACNGLRLWAENFSHVIVMFPVEHGVAPPSWIPLRTAQVDLSRVEVVSLPTAYRLDQFLRHQAAIRRQIRDLIDRARYLSFSIGGLIGDWGAVAAMEAHRKKRRFAIWTDRVESEVVREQAHSGKTVKNRWVAALTHRPMAMLERALIRRATVGLFHGAETYAAYARYAEAAEIVHDIHLSEKDRIPATALAAKMESAAQGPFRICYVGRADAMKGPNDWIQVMVELNKSGVDFQATWLGDGEALPVMRAEVARHGLGDRVELPGFVRDRAVLLDTLRCSHVLVFCHKTPESPRNLIEALVSGTPIIGYDSPFPRDLIASHGGGVLTDPNDISALAAALEALAHDRARLCSLIDRATLDGEPFNDVAVFKHRSEVIRAHL